MVSELFPDTHMPSSSVARRAATLASLIVALGSLCFLGVGPSSAAEPGQAIEVGETHTLQSKILGQERRLNIYLPPGYGEGEARYPVLYLLDGGVHEDFLHIMGIATLAADFRHIRPFMVVGIEGVDRYYDLTYPTAVEADTTRIQRSGGSANFRRFLAQEVKPWVEKRYATSDESVLIGESAAGLFVVETLLRSPQTFGGYIAVSPSLWWDGQSLAKQAPDLLKQESFPADRRIFLTIADEGGEMRQGVDRVAKAIEQHSPAGTDWTFEPMEQESHGTIFHPAALRAVRWIFATEEPTKDSSD